MSSGDNRLIIALDYGTTFTGVAYQKVPYDRGTANIRDSKLLTNWPRTANEKVPSEISYSSTSERNYQWGFDIGNDSHKMIWTKMELDQQGRKLELQLILDALIGMRNLDLDDIRREHGLPSYPAKEPVDIVADYLSKVREIVLGELVHIFTRAGLSEMVTDLVVTVPAIWSDEAQNLTFRAVNKAGFTKKYFKGLRDIIFVTEPEAAALYSIKWFMADDDDEDFLEPGDCFVQADLGGGTSDLISYCVEAVSPDLKLRQIGYATGDKCGATFVDRSFTDWLEKKLGPENYGKLVPNIPEHGIGSHIIVDANLQYLMRQFEGMKTAFGSDLPEERRLIQLPGEFSNLPSPERSIDDGKVRVTANDMREMFHSCISKITQLLSGQIGQVEHAGHRVRYVFLSGGFAGSPYMFDEIQEFGRQRDIIVKRPKHPLEAVARGAVAKRLEQKSEDRVYMLKCSKSYGITISQPYSAYLHAERNAYKDPFDNEWKAKEQMGWLIKKGDLILSNKPKEASTKFCRRFGVGDPRVFVTNLVTYSGEDAPQSLGEVPAAARTVVPITYDLSEISQDRFVLQTAGAQGTPYFTAFFKAKLELREQLRFSISFVDQMGDQESDQESDQELQSIELDYQ